MYSLIALMGNSISSDAAGATGSATGSAYSSIIMMVVMVAVFYFLLIRPQRKKDKEAKDMMAALKRGDKVVTIGGIHGTVTTVRENSVVVKVDDNTRIEFTKTAIASVVSAEEKKETVEAPAKEEKKPAKRKKKEEVVEAPKAEASVAEAAPAEEPKKD